ncbi:MAG: hypothetical protein AAF849_00640 [Bacteroidota bacterium]
MTSILNNTYSHIWVLTALILLASCKEAKPQTPQEREDAEKERRRQNVEQFYLGAIKMCQNTNYQQLFGKYREMGSSLREGTCCTAMVPQPYIDPYEYYIEIFKEDRSIFMNYSNPFELQKIREDLEEEKALIKRKALAIDANNLVHETTGAFVKYDVGSEELKINCSSALSFPGGAFLRGLKGVDLVNLSGELSIPLDPKRAEKLFNYYKRNYATGKLIPFSPLNIRITYGLKFPERNTKFSNFDGIVKTLEVYPADNWSELVATVNF